MTSMKNEKDIPYIVLPRSIHVYINQSCQNQHLLVPPYCHASQRLLSLLLINPPPPRVQSPRCPFSQSVKAFLPRCGQPFRIPLSTELSQWLKRQGSMELFFQLLMLTRLVLVPLESSHEATSSSDEMNEILGNTPQYNVPSAYYAYNTEYSTVLYSLYSGF